MKICKEWLKNHNIDFSGKFAELRTRAQAYKSGEMTLPSQKRDDICSIFHINETIGSMISTIASIMTTEVSIPIINNIDREIKNFSSNIHKVHTSLPSTLSNATSSKSFKPIWLSK